ncbi:MAG TPA: MFS transporter [Pseudoneobacillus sp.]|nr:MFS transporter [Pseudoneobacillus sp.]
MKFSLFQPLKDKGFRTLFLSQIFSSIGNWLDMLTIQVLITFQWGLGLNANAATVLAMSVPFIIIGPITSIWVDRFEPKQVLLISTFIRIFIVLGFFFAPNLWALLILIFLRSTLTAIYEPSRQSAIRSVVSTEFLAEASSLGQLVINLTKIVAPALGGALLVITTPQNTFIVEGFAFLIAFLLLFHLPKLERNHPNLESKEQKFWSEFKEGMQYIKTHSTLQSAISIMSVSIFIMFLYDSFFAPLSSELGLDKMGYGLISSSLGAGSVLGALLTGAITSWRKAPLNFMSTGRVLSGFLLSVVGLGAFGFANGNLIFWMVVFTIIGGVGTALTVPFGYILQNETEQRLMGRVTAFSSAVQSTASLVSPVLGALLGKWLGLGTIFFIAGISFVSLGLISLLFLKMNHKIDVKQHV